MSTSTRNIEIIEDEEVVEVVETEPLSQEVTSEEIAARAYEIYLSGEGGGELDNWLQAETELTAEPAGA